MCKGEGLWTGETGQGRHRPRLAQTRQVPVFVLLDARCIAEIELFAALGVMNGDNTSPPLPKLITHSLPILYSVTSLSNTRVCSYRELCRLPAPLVCCLLGCSSINATMVQKPLLAVVGRSGRLVGRVLASLAWMYRVDACKQGRLDLRTQCTVLSDAKVSQSLKVSAPEVACPPPVAAQSRL